MFRDQVYNTVGKDRGPVSPTFRRLNRRIHHNMGLLNTSRSSNQSSSFRMGRTELSAERYNSRDRDNPSQHLSGLPSQEANESRGRGGRKMNPILNLSRRRLNYQVNSPHPLQRNGSNAIIENLYMLSSNHPQQPREHSSRHRYLQPQSPRVSNSRQHLQEDRRRDSRNRVAGSSIRRGSNSRQPKMLQQHPSKEQSRLRPHPHDTCRDRRGHNVQRQQDVQLQRLSEKYLQNVYELNSPRPRRDNQDRRSRDNQDRRSREREKDIYEQVRRQPQQKQSYQVQLPSKNSISSHNSRGNYSSKNMNNYYFHEAQVSSTSGGTAVKTLQDASKGDTNSQASMQVSSVASMKEFSKGSGTHGVHEKSVIKLDRKKHRHLRKQKKKEQVEVSSLSMRWKMNNIQLEQRQDQYGIKRQEKVIDDVDDEPLPLGSVFLPIQSKRQSGRQWAQDILQRIILHLDCLNLIANYTKDFRKMYDSTEQWEVLIFLTYKKYYIQRRKIAHFLKAATLKKEQSQSLLRAVPNPFILPYSKIEDIQITRFRGSRECIALRYEIQAEDTQIRNALRGLYNLYIEKSGEHVNMYDCDNFSEQIYQLMLEEMEGISQNLDESSLIEPTKLRMGRIIQTGLLIAYLNGKYVKNFAQILLHEDTVKIGKRETLREDCAAGLYLSEFKRVLSS